MTNLMLFKNQPVEVFNYHGQALFNPYHIANVLDIKNVRDNIIKMNKKQVIKLTNLDVGKADFRKLNNRGENFLTKSGVYKLIFKSHKPDAEKFQDWVTDIVLPQIEQTGGYIPVTSQDDEKTIMAKGYVVAMKTIEKKDSLIAQLQPKAEMYDKLLKTKGYISLNKAAKGLKLGRNKMTKFLRMNKILFYEDSDNVPYQLYINSGYFTVDYHVCPDGKLHAVTKVSAKGINFIHKLYKGHTEIIAKEVA